MYKTKLTIDQLMDKYAHYPISKLVGNQEFLNEITTTGENMSTFINRRFSFVKPTLDVVIHDNKAISIDVVYGIGKTRNTLYSIDRRVYKLASDVDAPVLKVEDSESTLSTLEPMINQHFGIEGYKLPDEMRYRKIKDYLGGGEYGNSKYQFILIGKIDTLSVYADFKFNVMLNYILFTDAVTEIVNSISNSTPSENPLTIQNKIDGIYCLENLENEEVGHTLATRYGVHVQAQPFVTDKPCFVHIDEFEEL